MDNPKNPKRGDTDTCATCGAPIEYTGWASWSHVVSGQVYDQCRVYAKPTRYLSTAI